MQITNVALKYIRPVTECFYQYYLIIVKPFHFKHMFNKIKSLFKSVFVWNGAFANWYGVLAVENVSTCDRSANVAAILSVTVMFCHGKLHILVIQSTTLLLLFLQALMLTGTNIIDVVCTSITLIFPTANAPFDLANVLFQT